MQIQLWLGPAPPDRGLVLLERLEGEESIAHPLTGALSEERGMEEETLLSSPLNCPHHWGVQAFGDSEAPSKAWCVQKRMWPPIFPSLGTMVCGFSLNYIEMGALPMGSGPLTLLSTPHHFVEPQDERNQQASGQCGSNFKAHSKTDRCVSHEVYVQG